MEHFGLKEYLRSRNNRRSHFSALQLHTRWAPPPSLSYILVMADKYSDTSERELMYNLCSKTWREEGNIFDLFDLISAFSKLLGASTNSAVSSIQSSYTILLKLKKFWLNISDYIVIIFLHFINYMFSTVKLSDYTRLIQYRLVTIIELKFSPKCIAGAGKN